MAVDHDVWLNMNAAEFDMHATMAIAFLKYLIAT
jgi:hypothetical protein